VGFDDLVHSKNAADPDTGLVSGDLLHDVLMVGGTIDRYAPVADYYRGVWFQAGHAEKDIRIAAFSHLHVGKTSHDTHEGFYPYYSAYLRPLFGGKAMPRQVYDQMLSRDGAFVGGSPEEVTDKLGRLREALGLYRYVGQIDIGGQDRTDVVRGIERLALNVAPALRQTA
jgi:alkanesulfonate monooxygenase SsuD/methylene tetrahydromethanopterin reductase-like flavin-dependent oxidoreductase (luciferase family)